MTAAATGEAATIRSEDFVSIDAGRHHLAETPGAFADIDGWVRHRLRAVQLKHWKRGRVIYRELIARGMAPDTASRVAGNSRRWWRNSAMALNIALPNELFKRLGVPKLAS